MNKQQAAEALSKHLTGPGDIKNAEHMGEVLNAHVVLRTPLAQRTIDAVNAHLSAQDTDDLRHRVVPYQGGFRFVQYLGKSPDLGETYDNEAE